MEPEPPNVVMNPMQGLPPAPLLRILCLHGFRQSASKFRGKTHGLQKAFKGLAILEFVDAPFHAPSAPEDDGPSCAWWDSQTTATGQDYVGFWESFQHIIDILQQQGPYHGILGFSQGAAMGALLVAALKIAHLVPSVTLPEDTRTALAGNLRFAIFAGGHRPRDPILSSLLRDPIAGIKTLHIVGKTDAMISPDRSLDLAKAFQDAEVVEHQGGHYIPVTSDVRTRYQQFLRQFTPT